MNTEHLKRVRRLFAHDLVPRHIARANMKSWVRSVRMLGGKWIAIPSVERLQ